MNTNISSHQIFSKNRRFNIFSNNFSLFSAFSFIDRERRKSNYFYLFLNKDINNPDLLKIG